MTPKVLGKQGGFLVTIELHHRRIVFLILHVRDALEKQKWEHVGLEIGGIDRSAQDVRGFPKVGFELG